MRLDEILGSVVIPVVAVLLPEEKIQQISIFNEDENGHETQLRIIAEGETFRFHVRTPGQAHEPAEDMRHLLAEDLQDFIAESAFGWGQCRTHAF